ncbi:MAG: GTPase domain-containing protein [Deltaproteobacteria bacterium]|nr:GTPase domain-containing protein [Deltaproteobacteria bacterium]
MSRINPLSREISAKIVYYGPGLSGKTTTLQYIHDHVRPAQRGEMISLATEGDRTIFFDFLPLSFERVRGMSVRLQLYTVPGQVYYAATRKLVLNGADGVAFVADSQPAAIERNRESLQDLSENLAELGYDLASFPFVIQYNKRDLPTVMSVEELDAELNTGAHKVPTYETCATVGTGVFPALKEIVRLTIRDLKERREAAARAPREATFDEVEPGEGMLSAGLALAAQAMEAEAANEAEAARPAPPLPPEGVAEPEAATEDRGSMTPGVSFASCFEGPTRDVVQVLEAHIIEKRWAPAVRLAAQLVHEILEGLPGATEADGPTARAVALGLDGREFLRLSRLASTPDEAVQQADALFALHQVVAARLKVRSL